MKVVNWEHRRWGEFPITSLDFTLQKYLGVYIWHDGKIALPRSTWKMKLDRLMSCYLTPIKKVQVIRQSICCNVLFQHCLSDHCFKEAWKLNQIIRGAAKKILHLPS